MSLVGASILLASCTTWCSAHTQMQEVAGWEFCTACDRWIIQCWGVPIYALILQECVWV